MKPFPESLLTPKAAIFSGDLGDASISIPLQSFAIGDETVDDPEIVADTIILPTHDFISLANTSHEYPTNPVDGYIEASVFIEHAHHPVDITKLIFGEATEDQIEVTAEAKFAFSFEGLYLDIEDEDSMGYEDCVKVLKFSMRKES